MSFNAQGYNGFVDGSAYTSAWYAQPMPFYPTAMPYPQAYQYPTATIPTNRGGPRGRGRGRGRARGGASIRGNTGRGGSRTWVNPNIDANKYKYKAQSSASSSASTSNTAHGRGSANRVLVNKHTTAKPTPQAGPSTLKPAASSTGKSQGLKPGSTLVLNGITFTVGKSAKKLIRSSYDPSGNSETPVQVTHAGQDFIRTKSGNLIAKSVVTPSSPSSTAAMRAKRERLDHLVGTIKNVQSARAGFSKKKKSTLCKYFQKTGECRNARTCRYIHDSSKIAICPRFLRNNCPCTEATCTLSHTPNQHRMPHCVHFPNCKLGSECLYPHVHTAPDAPVCRDFAVLGWCDAGATQCTKRHVNECPEFSQTGTCSLGKSCKLPHVLRRKKDPNAKETTMPSIPVRQKRVIQPEESDEEVSDADGDERDSARVKRPRVDHLGGNADYITFIEASDEESDQEEEEQGDPQARDDDDAASVDSAEFDSADEPEPSSSDEDGADGIADAKRTKSDETFVTAVGASSPAPYSDEDDFDEARLMQ